jgi:hypothetical protein
VVKISAREKEVRIVFAFELVLVFEQTLELLKNREHEITDRNGRGTV